MSWPHRIDWFVDGASEGSGLGAPLAIDAEVGVGVRGSDTWMPVPLARDVAARLPSFTTRSSVRPAAEGEDIMEPESPESKLFRLAEEAKQGDRWRTTWANVVTTEVLVREISHTEYEESVAPTGLEVKPFWTREEIEAIGEPV